MTMLRVSLLIAIAFTFAVVASGQTAQRPIKICRGVPIPDGYTIIAAATSPDCPQGAYLIKRDGSADADAGGAAAQPAASPDQSRPRRAAGAQPAMQEPSQQPILRPPTLTGPMNAGKTTAGSAQASPAAYTPAEPEEVGDGDGKAG